MIGLFYVIIAQFLWACEFVLIRKFFANYNNVILMSAFTSIIGSLFYVPFIIFSKPKFTSVEWIVLVVLGLTAWFLPQIFYVRGIQKSPSAFSIALITLTMPVFSAILSFIFLKETLSFKTIIGGIFMVIGFIIISAP